MNENFKEKILQQLDKIMQDIDELMAIKGSISDLRDLPVNFSHGFVEARNWAEISKTRIEES